MSICLPPAAVMLLGVARAYTTAHQASKARMQTHCFIINTNTTACVCVSHDVYTKFTRCFKPKTPRRRLPAVCLRCLHV
jgi:hypothetical protein